MNTKTFESRLFTIRNEIEDRIKNGGDLFFNQVSFKLDRNYNNYVKEMETKTNYILARNNYKALKTLNKQLKTEENEEDINE